MSSSFYIIGGFALFQFLLYAFVLTGRIVSPIRGSSPAACASQSFTYDGLNTRFSAYDTSSLIVPPYSRAVNQGEEVFTHLSLLREATRDGWIHFAGDAALKQTYYEFLAVMNKQPLAAPLSSKVLKKRLGSLHEKDDARVGSTRLSYRYAPLYNDLSKDWEKVFSEVNPPSVIIFGAGTWDAVNRTTESLKVLEEQDVLLEKMQTRLQERVTAGKRLPIVLFLSTPTFSFVTEKTATPEQSLMLERAEQWSERMQKQITHITFPTTSISAISADGASATDSTSGKSAATTFSPLAYANIHPLAAPIRGVIPQFVDDSFSVQLNPTMNAVSLAAFTTCALGQPSWELRAFTPGQISLLSLWFAAIALWVYSQVKTRLAKFGPKGSYHRISMSEEVELGEVSNGSEAPGGNGNGNGPKSSTPSKMNVNYAPSSPIQAYLSSPAWTNVLSACIQLGCVLLFLFLMDGNQRISWSIVGDKQYVRDTFLFLLVVIGVLAWRSMSTTTDNTEALLNREQTEEWKGWMQILFVLYHYFAAKEMYNLIRIFIAAYVWMTGYGNFFFFYKTNDYSFARLMKLLFRLNFFVAFVCIALNREFMQYYVCALHTFYFLCVYCMMGIAWQWNKNDKLLLVKFGVLFGILFLLFDVPSLGLFNKIFGPFNLFYWNNSLWEWWFRSRLDHYATFFGMVCAWNVKRLEDFLAKIEGNQQTTQKYIIQGVFGVVVVGLGLIWMVYCLWLPKAAYNAQHPYTSIIPIVLYILLRNLTPTLRRHVLHLFTWFGKITLETYILQFHIWLSDDAATIITYLPNYPMFNFMLSTAIYVALSVIMFQLTNVLSDALIPKSCSTRELLLKLFVIFGGWYTLHNIVQFSIAATTRTTTG